VSKQVNMTSWSDVTAAVYTELLSDPKSFSTVHAAAKSAGRKKNNYWAATKQVKRTAQEIITQNLPTNSLAGRIISSALGQVDWDSLTRRIYNQGPVDSQVYRDISSLIERTNGNGKPTEAQ
jgi:hypothetical protein